MKDVRGQAKAERQFNRRQSSQTIRAALTGDDTCAALGITVRSSSPVLSLCRKLIDAGHDPSTPLEAYRGDTLALRVKSIGQGARLEVNGEGTGFRAVRQPDAAPPMRYFREAAE
jgi:hypothetical protein